MQSVHAVVSGRGLGVVALVCGMAATNQPALGGAVPNVEMTVVVSDGFSMTFNPAGVDVGDGTYNFQGVLVPPGGGWEIEWDFNAAPDPLGVAIISSGFNADNNSSADLEFDIDVTLPLSQAATPITNYAGSAAFGVTGHGARLETLGDDRSMWEAYIDDVEIDAVLDHPASISVLQQINRLSDGAAENLTPQSGPAANTSIGARIQFLLSAGDQMTMTGVFAIAIPVAESCCEGEGKVAALTMQYTGDDCSATSHSQAADKVSCEGNPMLEATVRIRASDKENPTDGKAKVWFDDEVALNDAFDVLAANAGETKLKAKTFLHIFDLNDKLLQVVEFHTSCSQPLFTGDQFGAALLLACSGPEPIEGDCCADGHPRELTMRYTGEDCSASSHSQNPDKVSCKGDPDLEAAVRIRGSNKADPNAGDADVWFDGTVLLNDELKLDAANAGKSRLGNQTFIHVFDMNDVLLQTVEFHTSCSQPLIDGDQFGSVVLVGCVGEDVPVEGDACVDGRPRVLTLEYNGQDCSASDHSQGTAVECDGDPAGEVMVRIRASDKENPEDAGADVWFDDFVIIFQDFDIDAANAGATRLDANTYIHVFDLSGVLLQTIRFHTSCSKPLVVGNQFGSIVVLDFIGENAP